jgi:hypothetical protein
MDSIKMTFPGEVQSDLKSHLLYGGKDIFFEILKPRRDSRKGITTVKLYEELPFDFEITWEGIL